jgi:hypothetical protein
MEDHVLEVGDVEESLLVLGIDEMITKRIGI